MINWSSSCFSCALFMLRLPKDDSEVIKLNSKKIRIEEATEESKEESAKLDSC